MVKELRSYFVSNCFCGRISPESPVFAFSIPFLHLSRDAIELVRHCYGVGSGGGVQLFFRPSGISLIRAG